MLNQESLPLISVVMPVQNGAATLDRAIRSVVAQTFRDWELLAVDDGSTDRARTSCGAGQPTTAESGRFTWTRTGARAARNLAMQNARGPTVCYLDHDDEYYPDYLELVARIAARATSWSSVTISSTRTARRARGRKAGIRAACGGFSFGGHRDAASRVWPIAANCGKR